MYSHYTRRGEKGEVAARTMTTVTTEEEFVSMMSVTTVTTGTTVTVLETTGENTNQQRSTQLSHRKVLQDGESNPSATNTKTPQDVGRHTYATNHQPCC